LTSTKNKSTYILGIDPGLASTGYGCIEARGNEVRHIAHGVIHTDPAASLAVRLASLSRDIRALIAELKPREAAVEELFFGRNVTNAISVSHARGVILLALEEMRVPISEYKPAQVKSAVGGSGRADKEAMQRMVRLLLGLPEIPRPDDAADGLAIALCHAHTLPIKIFF
jgi:crossover junction endodeoxyribonuclease RuvC